MLRNLAVFVAVLTAFAPIASAQAPLLAGLGGPRGYGSSCLHRNDDGSSPEIDLREAFPAGLRFFTETHNTGFVNTNGNITFSGSLSTFTPNPFPVADQPMIAPYWADVDIRTVGTCSSGTSGVCDSTGENSVWWHQEPGRFVVTWDNTGFFSCDRGEDGDQDMTFQLILTAVPGCGGAGGDFDVEFRFNECDWETGDASGGSGGFGGTEAQSGFDAGNSVDFVALMGSREPGIAETMCTESNVGERGVWRFQIRSGAVLCPEAGEECDTGLVGVCADGGLACLEDGGTECVSLVPPGDENCDNLDNDCDGSVDEGEAICPRSSQICDRGTCIDVCFEGGCAVGQVCNEVGRCVDEGCEDTECPPGLRCRAGECVDACDGVVCPGNLDCRGGRCLDLCEETDLTCDPECSACDGGECVPLCSSVGFACGEGESCLSTGLCAPTACVGVTCEEGFVCRAGSGCVDACDGAVCPAGERCEMGACVFEGMMTMPDAGMPDSGTEDAGADDGGVDGGTETDAGEDADGGRVAPRETGCGCVTAGAGSTSPLSGVLAVLGLALFARRRRR